MIVLDIAKFQPLEAFASEIGAYTKSVKGLKKANGFAELFLPGEIEHRKEMESLRVGITLDENAVSAINALLDTVGSNLNL